MIADPQWRRLDRIVGFCLGAGKTRVLAAAGLMIGAIAFADWIVGTDISLGVLYILPMLLAAVVLSPRSIACLAVFCSVLRHVFGPPGSAIQIILRNAFALLAYLCAGLFVAAAMRNRRMTLEHLRLIEREHALRNEAEEQLRTLVDSSPAGILTLDRRGVVLAANRAVGSLFGLDPQQDMIGESIEGYLPVLADALRLETGPEPFRTAAQSQGRTRSGEIFLADTWFSTYVAPEGKRLAAIVVDSSEEMREREARNLRQLSAHSHIMAGAMLHEVRNLCSAISVVYANTADDLAAGRVEGLHGLKSLVEGLGRIASLELRSREREPIEAAPIKQVLDDLRIVIEPEWTEIGGAVRWRLPGEIPRVLAERHGLLQAFLNIAQNSHRAVQGCELRELTITVSAEGSRAQVRFQDSGCGIADPQRLFQPFQPGAESTGLGLYISRSLLRSYGGELRFEPVERGACFVVELLAAAQRGIDHG